MDESPNRLINPRRRQALVHASSRSEDPAPVEKTLGVILGLDLQQTRKVILAPDLAREAEGSEVVGVVVDGWLVEGLLEVSQVCHHVVLLAVVDVGLIGVVGPLGRRQGDVRTCGVWPRRVAVAGWQHAVEAGQEVLTHILLASRAQDRLEGLGALVHLHSSTQMVWPGSSPRAIIPLIVSL